MYEVCCVEVSVHGADVSVHGADVHGADVKIAANCSGVNVGADTLSLRFVAIRLGFKILLLLPNYSNMEDIFLSETCMCCVFSLYASYIFSH